jgi:acetyltransferase-like isoleucine patch superfamily enzyme
MKLPSPKIHPSAIIEPNVHLGDGTCVWDSVHIRSGATIGTQCIVGEKTYIAYGVRIGHRVKLNAMVYICFGVTIEDGVMISAGTIFTNDVFQRATTPDLLEPRSSDPDEDTQETLVAAGATIGAGCVIGSGLRIGRWAMVGMGSVITRDVADFHLVVGNPARSVGAVCKCGHRIAAWSPGTPLDHLQAECSKCGARYLISLGVVDELPKSDSAPIAALEAAS